MKPLIYLHPDDQFTIPRGLYSLLGQFGPSAGGHGDYQVVMAALVLATLPMIDHLRFLGQRYFIEGHRDPGAQGLAHAASPGTRPAGTRSRCVAHVRRCSRSTSAARRSPPASSTARGRVHSFLVAPSRRRRAARTTCSPRLFDLGRRAVEESGVAGRRSRRSGSAAAARSTRRAGS